MNPAAKSTRDAMPGTPAAEKAEASFAVFPTEMVALCARAIERSANVQKAALDFTLQQSRETIEAVRRTMPSLPGMFLFDVGLQALDQCAETQKKMLDMAVEQAGAVVEYSRQRGDNVARGLSGIGSLMQESVERGVTAQRSVLSFAAEQNRLMNETMRKQADACGVPATAMAAADSVQRGMDALIDTQKELLDIASKPLRAAKA